MSLYVSARLLATPACSKSGLVPRFRPWLLFFAALLLASLCCQAHADPSPCPRYTPGSTLIEPKDLFSVAGKLEVNLTYRTATNSTGYALYCFVTDDGAQSPTLHVHPGDELIIHLKNGIPASTARSPMTAMPSMVLATSNAASCQSAPMDSTSVNLHYHGTNLPPICHQDEVIQTIIDAGQSYRYDLHFPADEPPGLYWYHPHVHGMAEAAVQGGASGAIIVEGIANVSPIVTGLPVRTLILRDNLVPGAPDPDDDTPSWDLSLNYIPVAYPEYTPVVILARPRHRQFWRILNASADTITDLQLQYDGVPQPFELVSLDGVPLGSQDGLREGRPSTRTHVVLPPAARAEIIVTAPSLAVKKALLLTREIDTGPDGDSDPQRPLASIEVSSRAEEPALHVEKIDEPLARPRFAGLMQARPTASRKLYFSEVLSDPTDPNSPTNFYITVDGQTPLLFDPNNPPAIVTRQGSVEDWTIENRALESHVFHIHQIHFKVLEENGEPVPDGPYLDTKLVPYWSGTGPYPSIKVRMDFRGPDVGDFVFHCHILGHEDGGMMAIIRVKPR